MARASLADLLARLRDLVADPAGASQAWSDDELQRRLDAHRLDVRYLELTAAASIAPGGAVSYLDFYAPDGTGDWEANEILLGNTYSVLSPASADRDVGHWTFSAGQTPPVFLIGFAFDLYAAAADVLLAWASKLKLEFDFKSDFQEFARSQQASAMIALAATYRAQARPTSAVSIRRDVAPC